MFNFRVEKTTKPDLISRLLQHYDDTVESKNTIDGLAEELKSRI